MTAGPLKVGLVAGEASGDTLGAGLIEAIRRRRPDARFFGVAGPRMIAAGCDAWQPSERLAVMGLFEILGSLPALLRLRREIRARFLAERPDVFVGIDAPEFNLGLAASLKAEGLLTVQYVSPQVWAWRQGRIARIARAVDLVLCLLPFERQFYRDHAIQAEFVGHPLADQIPLEVDRIAARTRLGIAAGASLIAILPGSRRGEVERLGDDFAAAARWILERRPATKFIAPMANAEVREIFAAALARSDAGAAVTLLEGDAQAALAAANAVLVASGTATLEATLTGRPMVVAYRLGWLTSFVLRHLGLMKAPFFAQPNLLAGKRLVPELFGSEVTPERLGRELLGFIDNPAQVAELEGEFTAIHRELRRGANERAAQAVLALVAGRS
ncbi:MAG TPA: lipid-A-disaccharide synthase [Steroidobacteraceae bacterium]|nr:lipid-A-disaccharide synthase [Steroidobacteraceae bacterium]